MALLETAVELPQKLDAPLVGSPGLIPLPVEQVAHRIHAQTVKVELLQPVMGGGLEEAAHLAPGVHEVAAAPLAAAHIQLGYS